MKFILFFSIVAFSSSNAFSETFNNYSGEVNNIPSAFRLCWLGDSVVGTLVEGDSSFTLAGDNSQKGAMFLSVEYMGRTVSYIKVRRTDNDGKIIWVGSMRLEKDGTIVPVQFSTESVDSTSISSDTSLTERTAAAEKQLTVVYTRLRKGLDAQRKEVLKQEEIQWIKRKEAIPEDDPRHLEMIESRIRELDHRHN